MSAALRELRDLSARQYNDEKNGDERCHECRISSYQEPLYEVTVLGFDEVRCSCCAWACADCGRAVATVHVLGNGHDWDSCEACASAVHGVRCGEVLEIPLGAYPALPPVLFAVPAGGEL